MFETLPLKTLKKVVKAYNLETKIIQSKIVDGIRKQLTQKELAEELHKHLEIREDGEIILKSREIFPLKRLSPTEKLVKTKKIKTPIEEEEEVIEKPVKNIVKKIIEKPVKPKKAKKPIEEEEEEEVENVIIKKPKRSKKVPPNPEHIAREYKIQQRDRANNELVEYKKFYEEYKAREFIIYQSAKSINTAGLKRAFKDNFGKTYAVIAASSMKRLKEKADKYTKALEFLSGRKTKEITYSKPTKSEPVSKPTKAEPVSKPTKATASDAPKVINKDDYFVIYDYDENIKNNARVDLTNYFVLEDVAVYSNSDDIISNYTDEVALSWGYMQQTDAVKQFRNHLDYLRENNPKLYNATVNRPFRNPSADNRDVQVFILRGRTLIGFIRSTYKISKKKLHIDYVFVSDKEQGKGYVGELMSMLFQYLKRINLLKYIKKVDLDYYADADAGWLAYDKGISRYGFKNNQLKYTPEDLKKPGFIKKIHNKFYKAEMVWNKVSTGSGMIRRPIEDIEMRI